MWTLRISVKHSKKTITRTPPNTGTFADQLRKTRVSSNDGPNREANGITALAEMTVKEYDRAPGTVGTRDQLIVARLRSQLFRLISKTKRIRSFSESTTSATDVPTGNDGSSQNEEESAELTISQKKELVSFLFYGLHPESGRPITRERDVLDMLHASGVVRGVRALQHSLRRCQKHTNTNSLAIKSLKYEY